MEATALKTENTTTPRSIRLTDAQYAAVQHMAGELPWGQYVKRKLGLEDAVAPPQKRKRRRKRVDQGELNKLSALMTQISSTNLPSNINQIARAINTGEIPLLPEDRDTMLESAQHIKEIRAMLMRAMGSDA